MQELSVKYARAVYSALREVRADAVDARRCIVDAQEGTMDTRAALRQARAAVARANDRLTTLLADTDTVGWSIGPVASTSIFAASYTAASSYRIRG